MANSGTNAISEGDPWSPVLPSSTPSALTDKNSGSASRWPPGSTDEVTPAHPSLKTVGQRRARRIAVVSVRVVHPSRPTGDDYGLNDYTLR